MKKQLVKWDKVTTKDGKPATVVGGDAEGYVVVREKGSDKARSVWSGNLRRKGE